MFLSFERTDAFSFSACLALDSASADLVSLSSETALSWSSWLTPQPTKAMTMPEINVNIITRLKSFHGVPPVNFRVKSFSFKQALSDWRGYFIHTTKRRIKSRK